MHPFAKKSLFLGTLSLCLSPCFSGAVSPAESTDPALELNRLQTDLEKTQPKIAELRRSSSSLNRESSLLQTEIRRSTGRLRELELQQSRIENQIATLQERSGSLKTQLDTQKDRMNRVLSAMTRLSIAPKTPLGTTPMTPEATVRTAILLRSLNNELSASAAILRKDLLQVDETKRLLEEQRTTLARNELDLRSEKVQLDNLLTTRKSAFAHPEQSDQARLQKIKKDSVDIEALINRLYEDDKKRQKLEQDRLGTQEKAIAALDKTRLDLEKKKPNLSEEDYQRQESEIEAVRQRQIDLLKQKKQGEMGSEDFAQLKGQLPLPVVGAFIRGEAQFQKGALIRTRKGAVVVSPVAGRIIYAGPFRNYGQMVILSPTEGYHIILAGFNILDTAVGETLSAGEPVGRFHEQDENNRGNPMTLYVEIRENQRPINPMDWFAVSPQVATRTGKASS